MRTAITIITLDYLFSLLELSNAEMRDVITSIVAESVRTPYTQYRMI